MDKPKRTFQEKLRNQVLLYTTIIVAVSLILFFGSLVLYNQRLIDAREDNVNKYLTGLFTSTYKDYKDYLVSMSNNENYRNYILKHNNESLIFNSYYTFNIKSKIKSNLVITDYNGNILLQTFNIKRDNDYFKAFNNMMKNKVFNSYYPGNIATGVYSFIETSSEYVMAGPVIKDGDIIGYIMLYLNGDDWNYEMSSQEFNGVITDEFNNLIATSSKMIVSNMNKFKTKSDKEKIQILDTQYMVRHTKLRDQNINIYSLVEIKANVDQYLFGAAIILILGISMLILSEVFSDKIAVNNSRSISKLINEIGVVQEGNLNYKIKLDTDDEIETIAENINELLERIKTLNDRNTELLNIKRTSEIKQLEAQFNPHFLYNTLETIRYSVFLDPKAASDLISLLTQILRYSVSKGSDEVKFSENIEYTKLFLKIYRYRFDKNFDYTIHVSDECNDIYVPKLLLQPIVENSIKYGYKNKAQLQIKINAEVKDNFLVVIVEDDGAGMEKEELDKLNELLHKETNDTDHVGLFNTARRLILQFGEDSSIHLDSEVGCGTSITIRIRINKAIAKRYREGDEVV